jgi:hypothetical protein
MTTDRRSYSKLSRLPAFGLYDEDGRLVATIRADSAADARDLFRRHRLSGARVRRVGAKPTMTTWERKQIAAMDAHARLRQRDRFDGRV